MSPEEILDRTDACRTLGISRQTLLSWIRKGKLKVWKRVGHGSNAALLFHKNDIEVLRQAQEPLAPPVQPGLTTDSAVPEVA
jgi:predicted DNA-binding protein (UPF0251 family)